jgi:hypothetical protein
MTATTLATAVRQRADAAAHSDRVASITNPESFVIGWLTQGLEDAYEVLMRCQDPAAKTFLASLKRRHTQTVASVYDRR